MRGCGDGHAVGYDEASLWRAVSRLWLQWSRNCRGAEIGKADFDYRGYQRLAVAYRRGQSRVGQWAKAVRWHFVWSLDFAACSMPLQATCCGKRRPVKRRSISSRSSLYGLVGLEIL